MFFHDQAIPTQTGGAERSVREHTGTSSRHPTNGEGSQRHPANGPGLLAPTERRDRGSADGVIAISDAEQSPIHHQEVGDE
jgi:hypothetical protein